MKSRQYLRIKNLEKKYSETNIAPHEVVSSNFRQQINKNYYDNQQRRLVDAVLNEIPNKSAVKEEVHEIVANVTLKDLCRTCKEEMIISVIILYCLKNYYKDFRVERHRLWSEYDITWRKYGLILGNLLKITREQTGIK